MTAFLRLKTHRIENAPPPWVRLNSAQQQALAEVIEDARRGRRGICAIGRDGCSYWAKQARGVTVWTIQDWNRVLLAAGECP